MKGINCICYMAQEVRGSPMWKLSPREKTGRYLVIKQPLFLLKYFSSDSLPFVEQ